MPRIRNLRTPETRKLEWITRAGQPNAIYLKLLKWEAEIEPIYASTSVNVFIRFFQSMYLSLDAHLDATTFDYHRLRFWELFEPPWEPPPFKPPIADYLHYYSELLLWSLKYKQVGTRTVFYKTTGKALKAHYDYVRNVLARYNVPGYYANLLFEKQGVILGRAEVGTFVGFAIVGTHKVAPATHPALLPEYGFEPIDLETRSIYDTHVGVGRVGHCRVSLGSSPEIKPELVEHYVHEIEEARKRVGMVPIGSQELLFPRVFYLPRVEKIKHRGGSHQVVLQTIINRVKMYLDNKGIVAQFRSAYIMFAEEVAYLPHRGHKRWKYYRDIIDVSDIIEKYVKMGLDRTILKEIAELVA